MRLIEEGADAILSIHRSSKLSGTYQSAWLASETLPAEVKKIPLELVDSQSASIGVRNTITWFREPFSSQTRGCWHSVNFFSANFADVKTVEQASNSPHSGEQSFPFPFAILSHGRTLLTNCREREPAVREGTFF
jgi:hypothetical protein